jgi:hypothetical protein
MRLTSATELSLPHARCRATPGCATAGCASACSRGDTASNLQRPPARPRHAGPHALRTAPLRRRRRTTQLCRTRRAQALSSDTAAEILCRSRFIGPGRGARLLQVQVHGRGRPGRRLTVHQRDAPAAVDAADHLPAGAPGHVSALALPHALRSGRRSAARARPARPARALLHALCSGRRSAASMRAWQGQCPHCMHLCRIEQGVRACACRPPARAPESQQGAAHAGRKSPVTNTSPPNHAQAMLKRQKQHRSELLDPCGHSDGTLSRRCASCNSSASLPVYLCSNRKLDGRAAGAQGEPA